MSFYLALALVACTLSVGITMLALTALRLRRRLQARIADLIAQEGPGTLCAPFATFYGQTSRGRGQIRGNGILLLSSRGLLFKQALVDFHLHIRPEDLREAKLVNSQLGKYSFRPLLYVGFMTEKGEDGAAFALKHPESWVKALTALIGSANADGGSRTDVSAQLPPS